MSNKLLVNVITLRNCAYINMYVNNKKLRGV